MSAPSNFSSSPGEAVRQKRKYTKRQVGPRRSHKGLKARTGLGRIKKTDHIQLCGHFFNYFSRLVLLHGELLEQHPDQAALFSRLKTLDLQMISAIKFVLEELKKDSCSSTEEIN